MTCHSFAVSVVSIALSTIRRHALQLLALTALALAPVAPAVADVSGPQPKAAAVGVVNQSTGAYTDSFPFQVPPFHGMEPGLGLSYASDGGNGFVGVGWALNGFSYIQRAAPRGGAPKYDANDIFLRDGEEMVNGCATFGGTHCQLHQTYERIKFSPTLDGGRGIWEIWSKDGTKSTFRALYFSGTSTFRWALNQRVDTHGNTVNYTYKCTTIDTNCYPGTITYNNVVISFYTDDPVALPRPDGVSFATGYGISLNLQRLRSVTIKVGASFARAYQLTYRVNGSPTTKRSMLQSVQEFGTDVAINTTTGVITAGSALPAVTFAYKEGNSTFVKGPHDQAESNITGLGSSWNGDWVGVLTGDFNGDGRMDLLRQERRDLDTYPQLAGANPGYNILTYLGQADGSFVAGPYDAASFNAKGLADGDINLGYFWSGQVANLLIGDFNGDGRSDILRQEINWWGLDEKTNIKIYFANSDGSFYQGPVDYVSPTRNDNACGLGHVWGGPMANAYVGDFNGDGKTDVLRQERAANAPETPAGHANNIQLFHSNGNGCFTLQPLDSIGNAVGLGHAWNGDLVNIRLGDFNGDGMVDILRQEKGGYANDGSLAIGIFLSNGNGTFTWGPRDPDGLNNAAGLGSLWNGDLVNVHLGDFNGDGKTDILRQEKNVWAHDRHSNIQVYYSFGNGAFRLGAVDNTDPTRTGNAAGLYEAWDGDLANVYVADFNGDGISDILRQEKAHWATSDTIRTIELYFGSGHGVFRMGPHDTAWHALNLGGDWNGDLSNIHIDDFNGDGKPDIIRQEKGAWAGDTVRMIEIYLQPAGAEDRLVTVNNGMGGSTTVDYTPSTAWSKVYMPVGAISQTVSSLTIGDGRGTSDKTTYIYYSARWSDTLRQPFGFEVTQATRPDGSYVQTHHQQTPANPGTPWAVVGVSSSGQFVSYSYKILSNPTVAPYAPLATSTIDLDLNGNLSNPYRAIQKDFGYDAYGNVIQINDHGDVGTTSDDQTTYVGIYPNTVSYIVDAPGYVNIFQGISTASTALIKQVLNHYDNATTYTTPPTKGDITTTRRWDNTTGGYSDTTFVYDNYGNVKSTTNPLGFTSTNEYLTAGGIYPTKSCNALPVPLCVTTTWDLVKGVATQVTNANGMIAISGHDVFGRQTSVAYKASATAPEEKRTTWLYYNFGDPNSQLIQEVKADDSPMDNYGIYGSWTNTHFDGLGRVWLVRNEGMNWDTFTQQQTYFKDASDRPWKVTLPHVNGTVNPPTTVFDYDALGRPIKTTLPDGVFETTMYSSDAAGKPFVRVTGPYGQEKTTWTDTDGRVVKIQEKNGAEIYTTTFDYNTYDAQRNNVQKVTDHYGNVSSKTIDSLDRLRSHTDVDRGTITMTYDGAGQLLTSTDALGNLTRFTYDPIGRMTSKLAGAQLPAAQQQLTQYFYDEAGYGASKGQLTRIVYPGGSKSQTWDHIGQLSAITTCIDVLCKTINQTYDSAARLKTLTYPDGEVVTYNYGSDGMQSSMSGVKGGIVTNYVTEMVWKLGRLESMKYGNGTTNTYTYDTNRGWLKSAKVVRVVNPTLTMLLQDISYLYDAAGRLSIDSDKLSKYSFFYGYDGLDRLTSIEDVATETVLQTYTYNAIGNITHNSAIGAYTYHPTKKHAVTQAGSNAYTYDANGNMKTGNGNTLTWDVQNRMASLTRAGITTTFGYDEGKQRIKKTTNGVSAYYFNKFVERQGTVDENFYYAGPILVARKDTTASTTATFWYHSDRLGSTRVMTDVSGDDVKKNAYKPFGAVASTSGSVQNERGFTGHITDAESSLIYMGARYYDAILGRFVSADTIVPEEDNPQAYNRYSYAYNNPLINTDPSGNLPVLLAVPLASSIGGALIGAGASALTGGQLEWLIVDAMIGFGGGMTGATALKGLRAVVGYGVKRLGKGDAQKITERASVAIFGLAYSNAGGFAAHMKGAEGKALFAAYVLGFAGGSAGALGRGFGFKTGFAGTKKYGKRMTYGDVLRALKKDNISWREFFSTIKGGLAASFVAGAGAKAGLHWSLEFVKWAGSDGNFSELVDSIDRRIKAFEGSLRKHRKHYDDGDIKDMKRTLDRLRDLRYFFTLHRYPCSGGADCN